jgi:hypothetical protein
MPEASGARVKKVRDVRSETDCRPSVPVVVTATTGDDR